MNLHSAYLWTPFALLTHYEQSSLRWKCLIDEFKYQYEVESKGTSDKICIDDIVEKIENRENENPQPSDFV